MIEVPKIIKPYKRRIPFISVLTGRWFQVQASWRSYGVGKNAKRWVDENCSGYWKYSNSSFTYWFEFEEDAVMVAMKFSNSR